MSTDPGFASPDAANASSDVSGAFDALYGELHGLASRMFARQASDHTLQPTALVHEAFLKLATAGAKVTFKSREHALALGAKAMRQLLANHANAAGAQKRGGDWRRLTLTGVADGRADHPIDAIELEAALQELEHLDERQCRIIECRYLGGLTIEETANVIGVSARTVELDAKVARLWLLARLGGANASPADDA